MEHKNIINFCYNISRNMSYNNFIDMLKKSCKDDLIKTIIILFYIRDPRGGKGERKLFRWGLQWLALNFPNEINKVIDLIPEYGRWDDIYCLYPKKLDYNRPDNYLTDININKNDIDQLQKNIVLLKINQLIEDEKNIVNNNDISYCAKWCVTENSSQDLQFSFVETTCNVWNITLKEYRKRIRKIRKKYKLIETYLTNRKIHRIKYNKVNVGAMKKYKKKLNRYDKYRFQNYTSKLYESLKDKFSINDIENILYLYQNNYPIENKWSQYNNYITDIQNLEKTMLVIDTNGSMYANNLKNINIVVKLSLLVIEYSIFNKNIIHYNINPFFLKNKEEVYNNITNIVSLSKYYQKNINLLNIIELIISNKEIPEKLIIISSNKIEVSDPEWKKNIDNIEKICIEKTISIPKILYICLQEKMYYSVYKNLINIQNDSKEIINFIISDKNININNLINNIINNDRYLPIKNRFN